MVTENGQIEGNTSFLRAARNGQLDKVLEHLKSNIDINTSNSNGLNALHLASKDGHLEIVEELLKRGAVVDAATKKGNTALHIASLAGQSEVVKLLVNNGASVNVQSQNGFTPLYMAAQENHDDVVKYLLANGANQGLSTEDGFTPLAVAMQQGHDKVVTVLLENDTRGKVRLPALHIAAKKDDVKAAKLLLDSEHNPDVTSKSGFTPLHIASHYGNQSVANLLLHKGADVNYAAKHNITPLHVAAKWGKTIMVTVLLDHGAHIESKTRDGLTPLHCAARSGHEQVVDILLAKCAPISSKTKNGLAPLHMAAQGDHVDAARLLLFHRAPVDEVTVDYLTALHVAAHCGHVRVAKLLLERQADANARALNGFTPLHIACKKNRLKVVELLLKHGASIGATTESGLTPLHVASFMGCMNIVIYLLQHDATPDASTVRGETPLHLAARANQTDIIRILLRNGAQVDARAREQQTPLHIASRLGNVDIAMLLLQHGAKVENATKDMYTALHIAAKEGQEEVASALIEHGALLDATTKKGFTPLHLAAKYGQLNVTKLLLQKEASVDAQGKNGVTPLHVASHYDHQNVALLLLEKGASPHAVAKNGHTPLHIAAKKNQMDIANTLLEYGSKPDAESKAGFTPLHLSAQEGHVEMSKLLIEHKADTRHMSKNGLTPLHLCAQEDKVAVAEILIRNNADIDATTKNGYTPLHVACHYGQINMVRFLLKNGANVANVTSMGYTALHQAAQQGHTNIINLLLEHSAQPDALTNNNQTPLNIAQKLGYITVIDTLKIVTHDTIPYPGEDKYKVVAPEAMQETFISDSEEEGGEDPTIGDHSYRYLTVDEMKSLGDDSLPIDVTGDERIDSNKILSHLESSTGISQLIEDSNFSPEHDHLYYQNYVSKQGTLHLNNRNNTNINKLKWKNFLVSFVVDARGAAMRGCRHSGVRIVIPSQCASSPTRITCRYVRPKRAPHLPPLMESEALASRILEVGPVGTKFLGPVLLEIPHFAGLRGKEREIIILRSDNGEHWKEHSNEFLEEIANDILYENLESDDIPPNDDGTSNRVVRIVTNNLPQYFAIVSRIRQEVHAIGPEGGMVSSTVVPQVQAVFPQGSLTKKIKVGLQAQPIDPELSAKLLGHGVAVSPIVTVEPRRRKFHKAITLTMPAPQAHTQGMINNYSGSAPTLRLLCSISGVYRKRSLKGGTTRAQWEDVTGSTPLTFVNDCVSFTTTVSARFWLVDCRNIDEATKMATTLYKEAIHVPFMAKFIVYAKRSDQIDARLRVFCSTNDKDNKSLEIRQNYTEVARSRDVEVLESKPIFIELSGNLLPVTKSGEQLQLIFKTFHENRLPFCVRVKDLHSEAIGRCLFMREAKVPKGELPQHPICTLNIILPEEILSDTSDRTKVLKPLAFSHEAMDYYGPDPKIADMSNLLAEDWIQLAGHLSLTASEIEVIKLEYPDSVAKQAQSMLRLWFSQLKGRTQINQLENALIKIGRDDIVKQCIKTEEPAVQKTVVAEQVKPIVNKKVMEPVNDKYSAEEKEVAPSDDEEHFNKSVTERRTQIEKRLLNTNVPASTQRVEIKQEITSIKERSLVEDKIAEVEQKASKPQPHDTVQATATITKTTETIETKYTPVESQKQKVIGEVTTKKEPQKEVEKKSAVKVKDEKIVKQKSVESKPILKKTTKDQKDNLEKQPKTAKMISPTKTKVETKGASAITKSPDKLDSKVVTNQGTVEKEKPRTKSITDRKTKPEKPRSPVRDDLLDSVDQSETYLDKRKFWEGVSKDSTSTQRVVTNQTTTTTKTKITTPSKTQKTSVIPVPKPRSTQKSKELVSKKDANKTIEVSSSIGLVSETAAVAGRSDMVAIERPQVKHTDKELDTSKDIRSSVEENVLKKESPSKNDAITITDEFTATQSIQEVTDIMVPTTEYQASFIPPSEMKPKITEPSSSFQDTGVSKSPEHISGQSSPIAHTSITINVETGFISDSEDVENYISDTEIEDRVPQIRDRQMSVAVAPLMPEYSKVCERSASLPTEDLYEVTARCFKARKEYYEEQVRKEIIVEPAEIETERSTEIDKVQSSYKSDEVQADLSTQEYLLQDSNIIETSLPMSSDTHLDKSELEYSEKLLPDENNKVFTDIIEKRSTTDGITKEIAKASDVSQIKQPIECTDSTIWETPIQTEEHKFTDTLQAMPSVEDQQCLEAKAIESNVIIKSSESSTTQDQISHVSDYTDIQKMIIDTLPQKIANSEELKCVTEQIIEIIEKQISERKDVDSNNLATVQQGMSSEYVKQLLDRGLSSREIELIHSVLTRRQREVRKFKRTDTFTSSIEITDEDLKYSGGDIDFSHVLEQQISQLQSEKSDDIEIPIAGYESKLFEDTHVETVQQKMIDSSKIADVSIGPIASDAPGISLELSRDQEDKTDIIGSDELKGDSIERAQIEVNVLEHETIVSSDSKSSSQYKDVQSDSDSKNSLMRSPSNLDTNESSSRSEKSPKRDSEFSSGESRYHSFDSGRSRPCSSDVEGLLAPGSSEYESALSRSVDQSSKVSSTTAEYHTAASSLEGDKQSFDSESSGNLASVETSEVSETLVPSSSDLEVDILESNDYQLEQDIDESDGIEVTVDKPNFILEASPNICDQEEDAATVSKMKRSHEMTFKPESIETFSIPDEKTGKSLDETSLISLSSTSSTVITVIEKSNDDMKTPSSPSLKDETLGEPKLEMHAACTTTETSSTDDETHSVTIITTRVEEEGKESLCAQITTTPQSVQSTTDIKKDSFEEPKRKSHRRQESTSTFMSSFGSPLSPKIAASTSDCMEPQSDCPSKKDKSDVTGESTTQTFSYTSNDVSPPREITKSISEKHHFEEAEADVAFNVLPHISPVRKISICPIPEDTDAENKELEQKKVSTCTQLSSHVHIPNIKITQHSASSEDKSDGDINIDNYCTAANNECVPQSSNATEAVEKKTSSVNVITEDACIKRSKQIEVSVDTTAGDALEKDNDSANSDSFEMLEKPDLVEDFVVIEELGKEASEYDTEGKSVAIAQSQKRSIYEDESNGQYLVHSAPTPLTTVIERERELGNAFDTSIKSNYDAEVEANRKWLEQQFHGDKASMAAAGYAYDVEFEREPLEDIKEEDMNDFDPASSRIGSVGSQKGSGGSVGSVKDSYSSTPEYDVLAGRKYFSRSGEHDDISMSSLQEFESLERAMSLENRRFHTGSQDSSSNGSVKNRHTSNKSTQGDDISVNSLKEFEGLEMACIAAHKIEVKAKEEEAMLAQIDECQETSMHSETESCKTISEASKKPTFDSDDEDYDKRMFEIDEIIRQAQTNVERFAELRQGEKTESLGRGDSIEEVAKVPDLDLDQPVLKPDVKSDRDENEDVMMISTDSLELKEQHREHSSSTDSLDQKTGTDLMTVSTDSIDLQSEQKKSTIVSSDSLEFGTATVIHISSEDPSTSSTLKDSYLSGKDRSTQDTLHCMTTSTDSLEPTSSTATHATYQFETDSVFSSSFTSEGSNTMVSSTDNIEREFFDPNSSTYKRWTTEKIEDPQDSFKPYVTEIIEPCDDGTYSHTIHRRVEMPPEITRVTFSGHDANAKMREFLTEFQEGESTVETERTDEKGNITLTRVSQKRIVVEDVEHGNQHVSEAKKQISEFISKEESYKPMLSDEEQYAGASKDGTKEKVALTKDSVSGAGKKQDSTLNK